MTPEIGRNYIGPHGWTFRVLAIEAPDGYPLVVIRQMPPEGRGTIRFPLDQTAKWLAPL